MNLPNKYNLFLTLNYRISQFSFIEVYGFFSFLLLITSITTVFALFEPPIKEEKDSFNQLLAQFKAVNATKKDVSDVIQTFQKPL